MESSPQATFANLLNHEQDTVRLHELTERTRMLMQQVAHEEAVIVNYGIHAVQSTSARLPIPPTGSIQLTHVAHHPEGEGEQARLRNPALLRDFFWIDLWSRNDNNEATPATRFRMTDAPDDILIEQLSADGTYHHVSGLPHDLPGRMLDRALTLLESRTPYGHPFAG